MKKVLALGLLFALAACSSKPKYTAPVSTFPSQVAQINIPNTSVIEKKNQGEALRGNSPRGMEDLQELKAYGVKQFIIFKNDKKGEVKTEISQLKELGYDESQIHHIAFDWKDNSDFKAACLKFVEANDIMNSTVDKNEKAFIHCTTGEDRTGASAAILLLTNNKDLTIEKAFSEEMCAKGYEAGEPQKPKDIVEKIRSGLTLTFLKMAYQVKWAQKNNVAVNRALCDNDPSSRKDFLTSPYSKPANFVCSASPKSALR
jgi:hypothetical protein